MRLLRPRGAEAILIRLCLALLCALLVITGSACRRPWQAVDPVRTRLNSAVVSWIDSTKNMAAVSVLIHENYTYYMVSLGPQTSPGHDVQISAVDLNGRPVQVTVTLSDPQVAATAAPGEIYYPHDVVRSRRHDTPVQFVRTGDEPGVMPGLIGVPAAFRIGGQLQGVRYAPSQDPDWVSRSLYLGSSGLAAGPSQVLVEGVARAQDQTVYYELVSADGEMLGAGVATAASPAPDWGYFVISVDRPEGAGEMRVFIAAPDGQAVADLVTIGL